VLVIIKSPAVTVISPAVTVIHPVLTVISPVASRVDTPVTAWPVKLTASTVTAPLRELMAKSAEPLPVWVIACARVLVVIIKSSSGFYSVLIGREPTASA
jgi:hypothetical protein